MTHLSTWKVLRCNQPAAALIGANVFAGTTSEAALENSSSGGSDQK